jgi:F-type H+-transporting ATPase subunit epsilon
MRFTVTTPLNLALETDNVRSVRAEDQTGSFGILPGHADFLTVLAIGVITWRNSDEREHHIAVRGGTLIVRQGRHVEVVTREAIKEDTLENLSEAILQRWRTEEQTEAQARLSSSHLQLATIRQIERYLQAGRPRELHTAMETTGSGAGASDGEFG